MICILLSVIKKRHEVAETLNNRGKCEIHEDHIGGKRVLREYCLSIFTLCMSKFVLDQ